MAQSDQELTDSLWNLSRRKVLQTGALATLAGVEIQTADASTRAAVRPDHSWVRSVDSELDPRVAIFNEAGIAVAFTDLLAAEEGHLYAFDVETGDRLWERPISNPPVARFHDGVVYHHSEETLTALDPRSGTEQWTIEGEFGYPSTFEGEYAAFATEVGGATVVNLVDGTIPWEPEVRTMTDPVTLVDGDLVLRGDQEFIAYDVKTGEQLWQFAQVPPGGLNLTVRASWPYCFITSAEPAETLALDLRDGTVRWGKERSTYPRLFVSEGSEEGIVLSTEMGTITGLDPITGEERWSQSLTESNLFVYLVDDGLAIPVSGDNLWAVSLEDGSIRWEHSLDSRFPVVRESDDTFFAADTDIQAFSRDGNPTWKPEFTGEERLVPAVSGNYLIATSGSSVYGFAIESESESTDTPSDEPTTSPGGEPASPTAEPTTSPGGEPASPTAEPTTTTGASGPGFGAVSTLSALLALSVEYLRRNKDSETE